ncbi:MAG: adenylate/guanylate cyclase domain-containing protein [Candidatus Sedimenticola sp. (ex Thyasira tokunagai)]
MRTENNAHRDPDTRTFSWKQGTFPLPIAYKLALIITLLLVIGMGLLGLSISKNQSRLFDREITAYGNALSAQLAKAAVEPVLAKDQLALSVLTNNVTSNVGIKGSAIYSDELKLLASTGQIPEITTENGNQSITWKPRNGTEATRTSYISTLKFRDLSIGYALLTFDRSILAQAQQQAIHTITLLTLVMVVIGVFAAFLLGRRLSHPINHLVDGSREISAGNYQFRFTERRGDELGQLMTALNTMTAGLQHKERVEQTFSRYVSPKVAKELLSDMKPVRLGGHNVSASVLFADIVGFTRLSEQLEAEEINTLLNTYFTLIDRTARLCHGHVDKYIGDCTMLLFGAPEPDDAHCVHAVSCGILIRDLVTELNEQREKDGLVTVDFRIGINSGVMLAGNMGSEERMEYTVVGEAVNLASRLSSAADIGQVIVSDSLNDSMQLNRYFSTKPSGTIQLQGVSEPITVHEIIETREDNFLNELLATSAGVDEMEASR